MENYKPWQCHKGNKMLEFLITAAAWIWMAVIVIGWAFAIPLLVLSLFGRTIKGENKDV